MPEESFLKSQVEDAIEAVRVSALLESGIDSWNSEKLHQLRVDDRVALSLEERQIFVLISYPNLFSPEPEIIDIWQAHSHGDQLELYTVGSAKNIASFGNNDPYSDQDPIPYLDREHRVANGMINGRETLFPGERLVWIPSEYSECGQTSVVFESHKYTQVLSRTWSPKIHPDYCIPLLLNYMDSKNVSPEARRAVEYALSLPCPRTWAPRDNRGEEWEEIGIQPQSSDFWLPQLRPISRKKR